MYFGIYVGEQGYWKGAGPKLQRIITALAMRWFFPISRCLSVSVPKWDGLVLGLTTPPGQHIPYKLYTNTLEYSPGSHSRTAPLEPKHQLTVHSNVSN